MRIRESMGDASWPLVLLGIIGSTALVVWAIITGALNVAESSALRTIELHFACDVSSRDLQIQKSSRRRTSGAGTGFESCLTHFDEGGGITIPIQTMVLGSFRKPRVAERWVKVQLNDRHNSDVVWVTVFEVSMNDIDRGLIRVNCPESSGRVHWSRLEDFQNESVPAERPIS